MKNNTTGAHGLLKIFSRPWGAKATFMLYMILIRPESMKKDRKIFNNKKKTSERKKLVGDDKKCSYKTTNSYESYRN